MGTLTVDKTSAIAEVKRAKRMCDFYEEALNGKKGDDNKGKERRDPKMICWWFEKGSCTYSNCKFEHPERECEQCRKTGS